MPGWLHISFADNRPDRSKALEVHVERDERSQSALASFARDGNPCGSMSLWLDGDIVEGFTLRGITSAVEVVVRDLAELEPDLLALLDRVCQAGNLRTPGQSAR